MKARIYSSDKVRIDEFATALGVSRSRLARFALERLIKGEFIPDGPGEHIENTTYVVPVEMENKVKELAQRFGISLDLLVREAIRSMLDMMERKEALQARKEDLVARQEALLTRQEAAWRLMNDEDSEGEATSCH